MISRFFTDSNHLHQKAQHAAEHVPRLMMAAQQAAANLITGEHVRHRTGSGQQFRQFREFDAHSHPQDIDWRKSAKSDHLYVREHEWQNAQTIFLWRDGRANMNWRFTHTNPTKLDTANILALALAIVAVHHDELFQLSSHNLPNMPFPTSLAKPSHSQKAIEDMAAFFTHSSPQTTKDKISFSVKPVARRYIPVLMSDFLDPLEDIADSLAHFQMNNKQRGALIQILDPAELSLPFTGRVCFEDIKRHGDEIMIENVAAIRKTYQDKINRHCQNLKDFARQNNWFYQQIITTDRLGNRLQDIWSHLASQE